MQADDYLERLETVRNIKYKITHSHETGSYSIHITTTPGRVVAKSLLRFEQHDSRLKITLSSTVDFRSITILLVGTAFGLLLVGISSGFILTLTQGGYFVLVMLILLLIFFLAGIAIRNRVHFDILETLLSKN